MIVTNQGPNPRVGGVTVTTELPDGLDRSGITPSQGSASPGRQHRAADFGDRSTAPSNAIVRLVPAAVDAEPRDLTSTVRPTARPELR